MIDRTVSLRSVALVVFALVALMRVGASNHSPDEASPTVPPIGLEAGAHLRLFVDFGDLDAMATYFAAYENDRNAVSQALMAGAYYRVHDNWKVGAFYRLGLGQRHDDDWIERDGEWIWRDTLLRPEHTFIADVTPRWLASFLPGEDWVFNVKGRYEVTLYGESEELVVRQSALIRPGLTFFLIEDREPVLNVGLNYATYLSLDFGRTWWYRHGPYVNLAYHLSPFLIADLAVGTQWVFWTESDEFQAEWPDDRYAVPTYRPWIFQLGLVYRPRG